MNERTNADRRAAAAIALQAYCDATDATEGDTPEDALADLIADLCHLHSHGRDGGEDFEGTIIRRAMMHYRAEAS